MAKKPESTKSPSPAELEQKLLDEAEEDAILAELDEQPKKKAAVSSTRVRITHGTYFQSGTETKVVGDVLTLDEAEAARLCDIGVAEFV